MPYVIGIVFLFCLLFPLDVIHHGKAYAYNSLHQLLSAEEESYTYDPNGNRLRKGVLKYYYDALNKLVAAGEIQYIYDALGRLMTRSRKRSTEYYLYYKDGARKFKYTSYFGQRDGSRHFGKGCERKRTW